MSEIQQTLCPASLQVVDAQYDADPLEQRGPIVELAMHEGLDGSAAIPQLFGEGLS